MTTKPLLGFSLHRPHHAGGVGLLVEPEFGRARLRNQAVRAAERARRVIGGAG